MIVVIFAAAFIVFAVVAVAVVMAFLCQFSKSKADKSIKMLCAVSSLGLWLSMGLVWDRNATDTLRLKQQQQRQSSVNAQGNEGKFRE